MAKNIYLSLGTNIGHRMENLSTAAARLEKAGIKISAMSHVYETSPVGGVAQEDFYNMCLAVETQLAPQALLQAVKDIEKAMGRGQGVKNGPRIIDIDLLFYDNIITDNADLKLPHPRLSHRRFVLEPLAEIAAAVEHPVLKKTVNEMLFTGVFKEKVLKIGDLNK